MRGFGERGPGRIPTWPSDSPSSRPQTPIDAYLARSRLPEERPGLFGRNIPLTLAQTREKVGYLPPGLFAGFGMALENADRGGIFANRPRLQEPADLSERLACIQSRHGLRQQVPEQQP